MRFKLSPSALSLMNDCSRCFWLENHEIWKRPEGIFPSLPNGMDRILKKHFDSFMNKNILPPELRENKECEGMKLFDDIEKLEEWRNSRKGLWYEDEEGNILHGGVDNILVKNGKLIVLDYKTRGYQLKDNTHEHYRDQMNLYTFLLRKLGYKTEDFAFLLFYIPDKVLETGEVIFETKLVKVDINIDSAEKLFVRAIELLNGKCPEKNSECDWCSKIDFFD